MVIYPHSSPIILTDALFVQYNGATGTSSSVQRQAAYLEAEQRVTDYIGTLLLPTTVTGTYSYSPVHQIVTDYGYVQSVDAVTVLSRKGNADCGITETSKCAHIRNDTYGVLDINWIANACGCSSTSTYQVRVAYTAGLPSGTITQNNYLAALVGVADIFLKEFGPDGGNESTGDIGITKWSNQRYSEERAFLRNTDLGNSPRANFYARIFERLRVKRLVGL